MIASCKASATVSVVAPVEKLCPFVDEVDHGQVRIVWAAHGDTLEIHALRAYLATWKGQRVSHEDFTEAILKHLRSQLGSIVSVTSEWQTAGMTVTVSADSAP